MQKAGFFKMIRFKGVKYTMGNRFHALISCVLLGVMAWTGCGGAADSSKQEAQATDDKIYDLTLHHHDPSTASQGIFFDALARGAFEKSNGRLKISVFHGAQLGGPKDTVDMVLNGTCDIGGGLPSFFPGLFPMSEALALPLIGVETSAQATEAIWEMYDKTDYLKDEYREFKVLMLIGMNYCSIGTNDTKIRFVEQLKGMKLRVNSGPPTDFIIEAGAIPISIVIGELYSSLERGVIDGVITDWNAYDAFKLYDRIEYIMDERVTVNPYFVLMNKNSYEALPAELREILDQLTQTRKARAAFAAEYDRVTEEMKKVIRDKGGEIYKLPEKENEKLKQIAERAKAKWAANKKADGYPAEEVMHKMSELLMKHK
jgi:TRAP-type C4-dicarboxylate transport system substrate-binding protein